MDFLIVYFLCGDYPDEVSTTLRYITGSSKHIDYPDGDQSIFGRIKRIAIQSGSRYTTK
jgi:hypothetical protein